MNPPDKRISESEAAVSPVIATILLTALIATAFAIVSISVITFTVETADKNPNVQFQTSANTEIIYHTGGYALKKSELIFYDKDGNDISSMVSLKNAKDFETSVWETGGSAVSHVPIISIVAKLSDGKTYLVYQKGEKVVLPTGDMVPDFFEIPSVDTEAKPKANVTIGDLYEIWDFMNQRGVVVMVNVTLDSVNTTGLTKVNVTVDTPPGKTYTGTVISIDAANLTQSSTETALPRQIVYDDPKNTTLTFGVFFDQEQSLPEIDYTIPGIAGPMYTDLVFTVYGTYTDNRTEVLYITGPVTFGNIYDAPPHYENIIFATETKNTKYVLGSSWLSAHQGTWFDSPLFVSE